LKGFSGGEYGVMFDGGADDVTSFMAVGFCEAENCEVVGFGA
jgi:hypothetical protein